ncbi:MAG: nitroreductase family protein [Bacteroidetes bacterium]|nr:nitroreductase family protein [Bacteroidota bacterium]
MDSFDAIFNRRSIRKYETKAVEEEKINKLLKAAMYAPNANDTQAWQFIVINDRNILDAITKIHPYAKMLEKAPLAILVCGDKRLEKTEAYLNTNCSAATQNLLLAAYSLDLGSVWLGIYPREPRMKGLSELLNLPENLVPISLVAIGYPAEKTAIPERFKQEKIHYNKY